MIKFRLPLLLASVALAAQSVLASPLTVTNKLYKISSAQGDSYLLGTTHMGVSLSDFPSQVTSLIQNSRVLLPELNFSLEETIIYPSDPITVLMNHAEFKPPFVDHETINHLVAMGAPKKFAERLGDKQCYALGFVGYLQWTNSLDIEILKAAHQSNLSVVPLDTTELRHRARVEADKVSGNCSIKALFGQFPIPQLKATILSGIQEKIEAYRRGEPVSLEDAQNPLSTFRNLAWLPAIISEIEKGRAFVSVGHVHLFGPQGLIELLRAEGYAVDQVTF